MNAVATEKFSKDDAIALKKKIVEIIKDNNFLCYSDSSHFDEKIGLAVKIKNLYKLIALYPDINDVVTESGHTLATLAAGNGYDYLLRTLRNCGVDLSKPAPNGITPAAAAWNGGHQKVLNELEKLGINLREYDQSLNAPPALHHTL
jgi:hypothetical protein